MALAGKTSNARTEKVKRLMRKLDQDGDGTVTEPEFVAACSSDPTMLECFGELFGTETSARQGACVACASPPRQVYVIGCTTLT